MVASFAQSARYFYHSFPRKARELPSENDVGCSILEVIRDYGLLLTPQDVQFSYEHNDGTAPRTIGILQRRVCFTELAPEDLSKHADRFGHFALEFSVPTLKSLGAIPVFYVPRAVADAKGAEGMASTLVLQLVDAGILITRIEEVLRILNSTGQIDGSFPCTFGFKETGNSTFDLNAGEIRRVLTAFTHAITPPDVLRPALDGALNFFAYADSQDDEELGYYREREWRIAGNFAIRDEELMRLPNEDLINRLVQIDDSFFGKVVDGTGKSRAQLSYVLPGMGPARILELANRIVVPRDAIQRVQSILKGVSKCAPIVALEELSSAPTQTE